MIFDFIIVGQGLAGSALTLQLIERGQRILVVDDSAANSSSRIAAGLFNPVTGKKMGKTWKAADLFPYLHLFYASAETKTGQKFFYPMPMFRPFLSIEEQNEWMALSAEPVYRSYISSVVTGRVFENVQDSFGGLLLQKAGFVDTSAYIAAVRKYTSKTSLVLDAPFDYGALDVTGENVRYGGDEASAIIFCSGVRDNPWFSWLPIVPLKGETMSVSLELVRDTIFNRGVYVVPYPGSDRWKVGATYNFEDKEPGITDAAKEDLEKRLSGLYTGRYEVSGQEWGFRPTTPDRRPIIGPHPLNNRVVTFNGLGTKGVSLAPYFSGILAEWLLDRREIPEEVHVRRFYHRLR